MQSKPHPKSFIYTWETDTGIGLFSLTLRLFKKSLALVRVCLFTYIVVGLQYRRDSVTFVCWVYVFL